MLTAPILFLAPLPEGTLDDALPEGGAFLSNNLIHGAINGESIEGCFNLRPLKLAYPWS